MVTGWFGFGFTTPAQNGLLQSFLSLLLLVFVGDYITIGVFVVVVAAAAAAAAAVLLLLLLLLPLNRDIFIYFCPYLIISLR